MDSRAAIIFLVLAIPLILPTVGIYFGIRRGIPFGTAFSVVFLLGGLLGVSFMWAPISYFMGPTQQRLFYWGLPLVSLLTLFFYRRARIKALAGMLFGMLLFYPCANAFYLFLCGGLFGFCTKN